MINAKFDKDSVKKFMLIRFKVLSILIPFGFISGILFSSDTLATFETQNWIYFATLLIPLCLFIVFIVFISYKLGTKVWEKRNWIFIIDEKSIIRESNSGSISIPRDKITKINKIKFLGLYIIGNKKKIWIPEQINEYYSIVKELS